MLPGLETAGVAPIVDCGEPIETNRLASAAGRRSACSATGIPADAEGLAPEFAAARCRMSVDPITTHYHPGAAPPAVADIPLASLAGNLRRIESLCVLPLATVHRQLGSLLLGSKTLNAYSREEVRFLTLVAWRAG